ncbi:uncharacterized protein LOC117226256 [Megalopta genalis]|uniref:uncharacterized protein LOC117226256 n=1 Tax=Megalopta genalis TaxID=115081 RepID=UPI003FD40732
MRSGYGDINAWQQVSLTKEKKGKWRTYWRRTRPDRRTVILVIPIQKNDQDKKNSIQGFPVGTLNNNAGAFGRRSRWTVKMDELCSVEGCQQGRMSRHISDDSGTNGSKLALVTACSTLVHDHTRFTRK